MSVRFKILKTVYKLSGIKRMFGLPQEKLFAKAAQLNAKRGFAVPTDKKHVYTDVRVGERGHCLKIRQPGTQRDKAMLFLFGGGMVIGPDAGDRKAACKLAFPCQLDVWMPWYPLCPKYNIKDAVDMVLETYRLMLREYKAENIVFCGFSSGASLAVCTCLHNLRQDNPMPNPACIRRRAPLRGRKARDGAVGQAGHHDRSRLYGTDENGPLRRADDTGIPAIPLHRRLHGNAAHPLLVG